ncbi:pentapeptide repeat-containing protein [Streptomyces sp. GbtcB6]|uniref:pentapeptide repeat-containing protein n=1 Tax=Streptomyces sp. GbtcB6 TaxID=2824751 RepID=UPI001C2FA1B7|nr:pentapeptide repeat-containing protein [Streptomyces sp. GbtcB6]
MRTPLPRRRADRRGLRLWPVGTVLVLTFTTALLVAAAVFYTAWDLLDARGLKPERHIASSTLFDLVKLSFGVVAGAGALVALVVAYRRQRVDEDGALREATRLHTERFTTAVAQLGEDSAAVRLGGVHALAGLANDAPTRELRQTCIDVLCAYLRLPYTGETDLSADDMDARHAYRALREVRHTVIRLIRDHLRLAPEHPHSWQGHDFDLTEATFDGGDLTGAVFSGGTVSFTRAFFSGGTADLSEAVFSGGVVSFRGAFFFGDTADLSGAVISGGTVDFGGAQFSGGDVNFNRAAFTGGTVSFRGAEFVRGTVSFGRAVFSGSTVDFGRAKITADGALNFFRAEFSGGTVSFATAVFSGGSAHFGALLHGAALDFTNVRLSDGVLDLSSMELASGTLDFSHARLAGGILTFNPSVFSGAAVNFHMAEFVGGTVSFGRGVFAGGDVNFSGTQFSGSAVDFHMAEFSGGTVSFSGAEFSGSTVDFAGAVGPAPAGLVPPQGAPLRTGLILPTTWHPAGS